MMSSQYIAILLLSIISLASTDVSPKEVIDSRSLKVFNGSVLVEDIECDDRKTVCNRFTLYYIYVFAARVPPSGVGGYITDDPQFACSHVKPPENDNVEWAALVYYSSMSCDCSYEEKILNVQAAGYTIALLMDKNNANCTSNITMDAMNTNNTNVMNITIPAVLLSETVGLLLLSYSSPTDNAEPTGSMFLEVHYGLDNAILVIIIIFSILFGLLLLLVISTGVYYCCVACYEWINDMECTARPEVQETYSARSGGDNTDSRTKQPTSAKAGHVHTPLQEINHYKQQSKAHEIALHPVIRPSGDAEITSY